MVDVGRREDRMLDLISSQKRRIDNTLAQIEEAMLARPGDTLLDSLWLSLR